MFKRIGESLYNLLTSRLLLLFIIFTGLGAVLVYRLFDLQIVNGESYLDNFRLMIEKVKTLEGTRGNIYDRNGNLLAYNELAYSVTIEDVYEASGKNENLNATLYKLIHMIESNGDTIISDFNIILNENDDYEFTVEGTRLLRFKADVYGCRTIDGSDFKYASADMDRDSIKLELDYIIQQFFSVACVPSSILGQSNVSNVSETSITMLYQQTDNFCKQYNASMQEGFAKRLEYMRKLLEIKGIAITDEVFDSISVSFNVNRPVDI